MKEKKTFFFSLENHRHKTHIHNINAIEMQCKELNKEK